MKRLKGMLIKSMKFFLRIFVVIFLILILIYSVLSYYSWNKEDSYIEANGLSGTELFEGFDRYDYDRERVVQKDSEPINYPKYCAIKKGMTRNHVLQIMKISPNEENKGSMTWKKNGNIYIDISLSDTGTVLRKMRSFDGEHESSLRWNLF